MFAARRCAPSAWTGWRTWSSCAGTACARCAATASPSAPSAASTSRSASCSTSTLPLAQHYLPQNLLDQCLYCTWIYPSKFILRYSLNNHYALCSIYTYNYGMELFNSIKINLNYVCENIFYSWYYWDKCAEGYCSVIMITESALILSL